MGVEDNLRPANELTVGSPTTTLPDHNEHLAKWRISQFEGQFESPTRYSRRSFLNLAGLITVGIATGGAAYALLPRNDVSAATAPSIPKPLESKKEPLLIAAEVFGNNVTTAEKLRAAPDRIKDFKLVTDSQGNVLEIILLVEDDKKTGTFVNRMLLNQQTGIFELAFQTTRTPLSIEAKSVIKVGRKIIVGGETSQGSNLPDLAQSIDSVSSFEPIPISSADLAGVTEMNQIPNTSKVILNLVTSLAILDVDTKKIVEILSGNRNGVVITSTSADNQTTSVYSKRNLSGLSKELVDLSTGKVLNSQLYFDGVYVEGYDFKKDADKKNTHILVTDNENQRELILELATNIVKPISYKGSIDRIPVAKKNELGIGTIAITNNWIWEVGGITDGNGGGSLVILNRPLLSDPNTDSKVVNAYLIADQQSAGISQQNLKWGIFGGKPGFLTNFEGFGLVFLETKQDGSPIEGINPVYLSIKDKGTHGSYLPLVIKP